MLDDKFRPRVALVLGAGSARGLAHIGVIEILKENHIPFDFIVGSSMGAMIGGIFAAGADIKMLDRMLENMDTSIFYDVHLPRLGFMSGKKIKTFIELMTKKKSFAELDLPLLAVATDLMSGEGVVLEEGSVAEAIRASISIPGIFTPVRQEGMILVDGAVADRLPIEVARSRGADIIIAVDVTFGPGKNTSILNTMDVIMASLDIMAKQQFDLVHPGADILIQPLVGSFQPGDFDKSRQIVDQGRIAAEQKVEEILEKIMARAAAKITLL
ncbi:MAG: patatin-like phospholipase family protein [Syntrophomonas sp.]|uniref:patatin-like phospholipase family protein n=1 Tax=Syntrophomonas sp. TaxID=2053627 RepID=UPI0026220F6B|nr:patatin-like phospholipase family protein [Syntrophomonas sp.]MDD2510125.1 patatin-like phospholipase family protein [Syntrophomonas sp.]MDD3878528.1 patatin-like phospholipase family protein [Syntrophomonas sp.]MDD4626439.1 patatin-like phospholipase family protein [Syntrophomonas sp.]